jgi:hypothetical protein
VLALDGVYMRQGSKSAPETLSWLSLAEPTAANVRELTERTAARLERVLRSHGRYLDDEHHAEPHDDGAGEADSLAQEQPALAACYQASASGRALLGEHAGKPPLRVVVPAAASTKSARSRALCAQVRGVNVHASAAVPARDRPRLERLCRYAARPPLSQERLTELPDGRLRLELKRAWADGTTAVLLSPDDLIARLCAAVPPPRFHLLRFAGVLAGHSALRSLVVPPSKPQVPADTHAQLQLPLLPPPPPEPAVPPAAQPAAQPLPDRKYQGRHPWAQLLRHVFAVEVERCPHCAGRMRLIELCVTPDALARVQPRRPRPTTARAAASTTRAPDAAGAAAGCESPRLRARLCGLRGAHLDRADRAAFCHRARLAPRPSSSAGSRRSGAFTGHSQNAGLRLACNRRPLPGAPPQPLAPRRPR